MTTILSIFMEHMSDKQMCACAGKGRLAGATNKSEKVRQVFIRKLGHPLLHHLALLPFLHHTVLLPLLQVWGVLLTCASKGTLFGESKLNKATKDALEANRSIVDDEFATALAACAKDATWDACKASYTAASKAPKTPVKAPKSSKKLEFSDAFPNLFEAVRGSDMTNKQLTDRANKEFTTGGTKKDLVQAVLVTAAKRHHNNETRIGFDAITAICTADVKRRLLNDESACSRDWQLLVTGCVKHHSR